jgi:hypothetical protein
LCSDFFLLFMIRTMEASIAMDRSSWMISRERVRGNYTFFVDFLDLGNWETHFLHLRCELLVHHYDVTVLKVRTTAFIFPHKNLLFNHEALDILGTGLIIELHGFLDLLESDLLLLIEHHQNANLVSAQHQVVLLLTLTEPRGHLP